MDCVKILCKKCNCQVGEKNVCECGTSVNYSFIKKCMPCGIGSGFYEKFVCFDCDGDGVKRFINIQNNIGYVGRISKAILNIE